MQNEAVNVRGLKIGQRSGDRLVNLLLERGLGVIRQCFGWVLARDRCKFGLQPQIGPRQTRALDGFSDSRLVVVLWLACRVNRTEATFERQQHELARPLLFPRSPVQYRRVWTRRYAGAARGRRCRSCRHRGGKESGQRSKHVRGRPGSADARPAHTFTHFSDTSSPEFTHFEIVSELHVSVCAKLRKNQKLGLTDLIRKRRIHFSPLAPCLQVPPSRALAAAHASSATPMPPWWTESPDAERHAAAQRIQARHRGRAARIRARSQKPPLPAGLRAVGYRRRRPADLAPPPPEPFGHPCIKCCVPCAGKRE